MSVVFYNIIEKGYITQAQDSLFLTGDDLFANDRLNTQFQNNIKNISLPNITIPAIDLPAININPKASAADYNDQLRSKPNVSKRWSPAVNQNS